MMTLPYQARVILRDGMHFEGYTNDPRADDFRIDLDTTPAAGGQGKGVRPAKLLLISLAGCMAMDVLSILRKKQQQVTGLEVRVSAQHAPDYPKVYTSFEVRFDVTGKQVDPEAVRRAIELSYEKYCPIANLLKPVAPVETRFEIAEG